MTVATLLPEVEHHPTHVMLHIDQLVPTPDNPRHFRVDEAFDALCQSVRKLGILSPLIARPMPHERPKPGREERFDLRAGHRRLEAARRIGLHRVPVIVRDMDDREAMEITVTENLQREDLSPLEESDGVQRLLDVGWSVEEIADRFGKGPQWVARRAKLRGLCGPLRMAMDEPSHWLAAWPAGHLEALAKLAEATQHAVFERLDDAFGQIFGQGIESNGLIPRLADLETWIARGFLHTLAGAPWKLDDETLLPAAGACTACPKRSSCEPLLFDADADPDSKGKAAKDRCLDRECYERKGAALAKRNITSLTVQGQKPVQLIAEKTEWETREELKKKGGVDERGYIAAKANTAGAIQAVVVSGPATGEARWVKPAGKPSSSGSSSRSSVSREVAKPKSLKEKQKGLEKRRRVWAIGHVVERLEAIIDELPTGSPTLRELLDKPVDVVQLACAFGTAWNAESVSHDKGVTYGMLKRPKGLRGGWLLYADLVEKAPRERAEEQLWCHVLRVWVKRMSGQQREFQFDQLYSECERICRMVGWSFVEIRAAAEDAVKTPKSWQAELDAQAAKGSKSKGKRAAASPANAPLNAHTGRPDPALGLLRKGKPSAKKSRPRTSAAAAATRKRPKDQAPAGKPAKKPAKSPRKGKKVPF